MATDEHRLALARAGVDLVSGPLCGGSVDGDRLAALLLAQDAVVDPRPLPARPAPGAAPKAPAPAVRGVGIPAPAASKPAVAAATPAFDAAPAPSASPPKPAEPVRKAEPAAPAPQEKTWQTADGQSVVGGWASAQGLNPRKGRVRRRFRRG